MKRYLKTIMLAATLLSLTACNDDAESLFSNNAGSTLEIGDNFKISRFRVPDKYVVVPVSTSRVAITFSKKDDSSSIFSFDSDVKFHEKEIEFAVEIPHTVKIENGEYIISAVTAEGSRIGVDFTVEFRDEMLCAVLGQSVAYTLSSGSGTKEDPYIIRNKDEFNQFLFDISRDSVNHGKGKYFKQKASFKAPAASDETQGRGYGGEMFAGSYDGGGYSIGQLSYIGSQDSKKDVSVGLFRKLLDGASVSNLTIEGVNIQKVHSCCGALAGESSGTVTIDNVRVSGSISDCINYTGGLIGYVTGTLHVNRYDFNVTLSGNTGVGGLAGFCTNAGCKISNVTTAAKYFLIEGAEYVGGLFGYLRGSAELSGIHITHSVSEEDSDILTVSALQYAGGLIGYADLTSASTVRNSRVQAPVGCGTDHAGGLMGYIRANDSFTLASSGFNSLVSGENRVGGFFGQLQCGNNGKVMFDDTCDLSVINGGASGVSASGVAGGVAGEISGVVEIDGEIILKANVSCTNGNSAGGFAGKADRLTISVDNIKPGDNMRISGVMNIGGLFGEISRSTVMSSQSFNYADPGYIEVPQKTKFKTVSGCTVNASRNGGGIAGYVNRSTLKGLHSAATVNCNESAGGIAGYVDQSGDMNMHVEDCTFSGKIMQGDAAGGICGTIANGGYYIDCINYSDITGESHVGGVVGYLDYKNTSPAVNYCVNTGNISGAGNTGGVVGYMKGGSHYCKVTNCANYGSVSGTSGGVGGIVGACVDKRVKVLNCANHGHISAGGSCHGVGGVAGSLGEDPNGVFSSENLEVGYCYNDGEVSSTNSDNHLGGILGYQEEGAVDKGDHDSWLHDCLNRGDISSKQHSDNGGILGCGDHYAYVENVINLGSIAKGNGTVGTHKSSAVLYHDRLYQEKGKGKTWPSAKEVATDKLGDAASYPGLDFNSVWEIHDKLPYLRKCPFQRVTYRAE